MAEVRLGDVVQDEPGAVAMACASLGWRVFPLMPGRGTPAIKNWPGRATTDAGTIEEWWGWSFPGSGVGVATGKRSGIWVLDIDVKNGVDGFAAWERVKAGRPEPPPTFTVKSRSGGGHLYWAWSADAVIRNSAGTGGRGIAPGLDVRGEGGYVRAPLKTGDVLVPVNPAVPPDWLVTAALRAGGAEQSGESRGRERRGSGGPGAARPVEWTDTRDALRHSAARLAVIGEGGRNDALNRASFLLARWSRETGVTRELAWNAMRWACAENGLWQDDGPEACQATFTSGWNAGAAAAG